MSSTRDLARTRSEEEIKLSSTLSGRERTQLVTLFRLESRPTGGGKASIIGRWEPNHHAPATVLSCSLSQSTKRGSRAAQRRHAAVEEEGGLPAEEEERESGARQRRPPLPRLASPRRSVREHIVGEGEGLSGEGTRASLAGRLEKHRRTLLHRPGEGELVGEEGEEEAATEEEQAPAKVKNQKVIPIHCLYCCLYAMEIGICCVAGKLVAKQWTAEDEAADNELRRGVWMMEDTAAVDEL
uniref:Uncharacterized protein n=1 Tax=Oryza punctata TaxID=4537 RepID=A0A0E0K082_ORYPU